MDFPLKENPLEIPIGISLVKLIPIGISPLIPIGIFPYKEAKSLRDQLANFPRDLYGINP